MLIKTKTPWLWLFFLTLLLVIPSFVSAWAEKAEDLYQQGLFKESAERDPEKALELFRAAVEGASAYNPALAANARLHMGLCLEKLGKKDEALGLYLVITKDPDGIPSATLLAAKAKVEKIKVELKRAADQAALEEAARRQPTLVMVPEFRTNALSLLAGTSLARGSGSYLVRGDVALRLRIFGERPRPVYLEVGALIPGGEQPMGTGTFQSAFLATDQAELRMGYQIHMALVRDLPHGSQTAVVPEIGIGAAWTRSRINVITSATDDFTGLPTMSSEEIHESIWSPYVRAGLRCFANRRVSLLLSASYVPSPYKGTVETSTPSHTASFNFAQQLWTVGAQLQLRFGRTEFVARPRP